jgi:hypothetical protein
MRKITIESEEQMNKDEVIKETKYCQILAQSKVTDGEYTYSIEKVFVKAKNRDEIRFCLYKDTKTQLERYVPRSLDVTELEFLELFREALQQQIFSKELVTSLKNALTYKKTKDTIKANSISVDEEEGEGSIDG